MSQLGSMAPRAMRDTFLQSVYDAMLVDPDVFIVSADFGSPVLDKIRADCPDRFINVGIAEQNLINVSAGLALEGFKVFAYAIAPFITMRCFEQIRVNLGLLSEVRPMNVNLVGVGAGYSYVVSGPTHQCYEDITLMRAIPNMQVLSLADQRAAAEMPKYCLHKQWPKYLRLDAQVLPILYAHDLPRLDDGYHVHRKGGGICLLATGYMMHTALSVAEAVAQVGINLGIIDLFDLSRFDKSRLNAELTQYKVIVTMEEGFSGRGGMDSMMFNHVSTHKLNLRIVNIGVECGYRFEIGERHVLHEQVGLGTQSIIEKITLLNGTL